MNIIVPHGFEPNYTLGFVKGLLKNDIKVCVISSDTEHQRLTALGIQAINMRGSQDINRSLAAKAFTLLNYYIKLVRYVFYQSGCVLHFTGLFRNELILFEGLFLSICFRLFSFRYVYTVHNILPHSRANSRIFRCIYWVVYQFPNALIVHTNLAKQQLMSQFSVPSEKIIVISIGMNEEISITGICRESAKKCLGFKAEDRIILYFGKIDEYKGLETLIEAFDKLDLLSTKLLIGGWFPSPAYRLKIISVVRKSSRLHDICLHEAFIPNEDVEIFFKSADVLCLPYKNIYQSGVVFLCLRFGLPIVATDVGSFKEFIDETMGIVVDTNDAKGIASGLKIFFENQSRYESAKISANAQKYKWENICKNLVSLYR